MSDLVKKALTLNNVHYNIFNAPPVSYYDNVEGFLKSKSSPNNLANDINSAENAVGATIYIVNERYQVQYATNLFYLTNFSFALKERTQVTNSLKEPILAFFDESVKVYTFQGAAPEAASIDGSALHSNFRHSSIVHLYNNHLRGTQLVKNKHIAVLKVGNHTVYGYPLNLNSSLDSGQDKVATFNMNWAVAKHTLDLPGVVTLDNLEYMSNVQTYEYQDIILFINYLSRYTVMYQQLMSYPDPYLKNVFMLSDLTDLAEIVSDLYKHLITSNILNPYELFLLELTKSVETVKTAKSVGSWTKYIDTAEGVIGVIKEYQNYVQEGKGRVHYE